MSDDLRLERVYDAAPEIVFDAFTDPDAQKELYADGPEWVVESACDLRVGCERSTSALELDEDGFRGFAREPELAPVGVEAVSLPGHGSPVPDVVPDPATPAPRAGGRTTKLITSACGRSPSVWA